MQKFNHQKLVSFFIIFSIYLNSFLPLSFAQVTETEMQVVKKVSFKLDDHHKEKNDEDNESESAEEIEIITKTNPNIQKKEEEEQNIEQCLDPSLTLLLSDLNLNPQILKGSSPVNEQELIKLLKFHHALHAHIMNEFPSINRIFPHNFLSRLALKIKNIKSLDQRKRVSELTKAISFMLLVGLGAGLNAVEYNMGLNTIIHEYVGHLQLGGHLIYTFNQSREIYYNTTYQVDGMEKFFQIKEKGFRGVLEWMFTRDDVFNDGRGGWAIPGANNTGSTPLALQLGEKQSRAWVSLSGSLPGLYLNSLRALGAALLFPLSPAFTFLEVTDSFMGHVNEVTYAYNGLELLSNTTQFEAKANAGHDFASVYYRLADHNKVNYASIGYPVAIFYTMILPLVVAGLGLHNYAQREHAISDDMAVKKFLNDVFDQNNPQAIKKFHQLNQYNIYKNWHQYLTIDKNELLESGQLDYEDYEGLDLLQKRIYHQVVETITQHLDSTSLMKLKRDVLKQINQHQKVPWFDHAAYYTSIVSNILLAVNPLLRSAGIAGDKNAQGLSQAITYTLPLVPAAVVAKNTYKVINDWQTPDEVMPKKSKILSTAELVNDLVILSLTFALLSYWHQSTTITELPEMLGGVYLPVLFLLRMLGNSLSIARQKVMKEHINKNLRRDF